MRCRVWWYKWSSRQVSVFVCEYAARYVASPLYQFYRPLSLCRFAADVLRRVLWRGRHKRGGFLQVGVQQRPRRAARQGRRPQIRHSLLYLAAWSWGRIRQQLGLWPHPLQRWIDVEGKKKKKHKIYLEIGKKHLGDFQHFLFCFVFFVCARKMPLNWNEIKWYWKVLEDDKPYLLAAVLAVRIATSCFLLLLPWRRTLMTSLHWIVCLWRHSLVTESCSEFYFPFWIPLYLWSSFAWTGWSCACCCNGGGLIRFGIWFSSSGVIWALFSMFFMTENLIKNANCITLFRSCGFSVVSLQLWAMNLIETFNFDLFAAAAAAAGRRDASAGPTWPDVTCGSSHHT